MSSHDWKCRGCGCTEDRACVDADGVPCVWVEPPDGERGALCSECAEKAEAAGTRPRLTPGDYAALLASGPVRMELDAAMAWGLLGALHLALRHPEFARTKVAVNVSELARALEGRLGVTPNLAALAAAGRDPACDGPVEDLRKRGTGG